MIIIILINIQYYLCIAYCSRFTIILQILFEKKNNFSTNYISMYEDLFKNRGIYRKEAFIQKRIKFNNYPAYLKETLFHDDPSMKKLRGLEISEKFFLSEDWREKGNRSFSKGDFKTALIFYTRVRLTTFSLKALL